MLSSKRKQQAIALAKEEAHGDFFRVHPWSHIAPYENVRGAGIGFVENTKMSLDDKLAFGTLVAQTYQAEIVRLTREQQIFRQNAGTAVSQEEKRALMQILQIIASNGIPLPESLQQLFPGGDHQADLYYSTYTVILASFGDEHIIPLNQALANKQIVHWSCGEHNAFDQLQIRLQQLVEAKVNEPAGQEGHEPEEAGNTAELVFLDALADMNVQAGGHVARGQSLRVPPPVTPLMTLDPFQNAYHGQVEIKTGTKKRPKTESRVIGVIREVYEAERDKVGEAIVEDPGYWLEKVNWMSVYLLEDLDKFMEVAWILGDYDPVSSGVPAGIKATPEQIAGYLMAGVDDEEWAIRVIKMHLRTPEQKAWLAAQDYSIEDVLNGRTYSEPEIQAMFDDWNAKLGVKAFGF